jgi:hypothetical protein
MTGYLHPLYAKSLSEFGRPVELPQCGGWLLERPVPGSGLQDAMGCYPLFCCSDWSKLPADIAEAKQRNVTIALVADPFASVTVSELARCFDLVRPFKTHFVIDVNEPIDRHVNSHHRYYARRALKMVDVTMLDQPKDYFDDWVRLYQLLVVRHSLCGIKAFSKSAFAMQFEVPGLMVFRATRSGGTIGMHLWYVQSGVAYSHLSAFDEEGYSLRAAYALYWCAIQEFKQNHARELRWIDLGAGAGARENESDGLSIFKRGWTTIEKVKYFCGSILDLEAYESLTRAKRSDSNYFPLYRAGELS